MYDFKETENAVNYYSLCACKNPGGVILPPLETPQINMYDFLIPCFKMGIFRTEDLWMKVTIVYLLITADEVNIEKIKSGYCVLPEQRPLNIRPNIFL